MTEREPPPSLKDLDARLERAREAQDRRAGRGAEDGRRGALGFALQAAIEMVAPLAVAVLIGWFIDNWLATGPLFLVLFFFLGAAAGGLNVYRRALQLMGGDGKKTGNAARPGDAK